MKNRGRVLIFGSTGAIGQDIVKKFHQNGWFVVLVSRQQHFVSDGVCIVWDVLKTDQVPIEVNNCAPFDAVVWAQGKNINDNIYSFNRVAFEEIHAVNVTYILASLHYLVKKNLLSRPARLCVLSSIWQNISRESKLSYGISKASLNGLVLSLSNDLSADGHLVNAVLPGVLDTPMTHQNLSNEQIKTIECSTKFKRLPQLSDVVNTVYFLCSRENTGITGQSIKVDLGYSDVRNF